MTETVPTADRLVVLAVVLLLGVFGLIGLSGIIWLVHDKADPAAVAVVSTLTGAAVGSLGTLLASARTSQPVQAAAEAVGFQKAVDQVNALDPQPGKAKP